MAHAVLPTEDTYSPEKNSAVSLDPFTIMGEHSNQNQIWCINIGECMVFASIVGSDYYLYHRPPRY